MYDFVDMGIVLGGFSDDCDGCIVFIGFWNCVSYWSCVCSIWFEGLFVWFVYW